MIGIDVKETVPFSVKQDVGEVKTVFVLGPLTQRDRIEIFGKALGKDGKVDPVFIQDKAIEIFKKGVREIRNLRPGSPSVSDFSDEVIDSLPFEVLMEVVAEIMKLNFEAGEERKN